MMAFKMIIPGVSVLLVFFLGEAGWGAGVKDSSQFTHKYEGGYPVGSSYQEFADPAEWLTPPSSDGSALSFQSSVATGNNFWYYDWAGVVSHSVGFTYETRVKIDGAGTHGPLGAVQFYMTDGGPGVQGTTIRLGKDGLNIPTLSGPLVIDGANYADGQYHVVRAAQEPNSADFTIWSDGVLVGTYPAGFAFGGPDTYFGDGSGDIGGGLVMVDYVRFDNTGAFAPIPEPSGGVLLGLSLATAVFTVRPRRTKC